MKFFVNLIYILGAVLSQSPNCSHEHLQSLYRPQYSEQTKHRVLETSNNYATIRMTYDYSSLSSLQIDQKNYIINIFQNAINFYSSFLTVQQLLENNKFPSSNCADYTVMENDRAIGIPNSDLHFYLTPVQDSQNTYLAQALYCVQDSKSKRPLFGLIKINTALFDSNTLQNNFQFQKNVQTIVHEIMHILAFSGQLFRDFPSQPSTFTSNTGKKYLVTSNVKALSQQYFNCQTLPGMGLENNGETSSAGSHWERTWLGEDIMTASELFQNMKWSQFNNALLLDSGWYQLSQSVYEETLWGKGQGCDFVNKLCTSSQQYKEFCQVPDQFQCTLGRESIGVCSNQDPFADGCYYVMALKSFQCNNQNNQDPNYVRYSKESYSSNSRCFQSSLAARYVELSVKDQRCHQFKCIKGQDLSLQMLVFVEGQRLVCDSNSKKIKVVEMNGELTCPENIQEECQQLQQNCRDYCSQNGFCFKGNCLCLPEFSGPSCLCKRPLLEKNGKCVQKCQSSYYFDQQAQECLELCSSNQFTKSNSCYDCRPECLSCVDENHCLVCKQGYLLSSGGQCANASLSCEKGQLQLNGVCIKCYSQCAICQNQPWLCETCSEGYGKNPKTGECEASACPSGAFLENPSNTCSSCSSKCQECQNDANQCTACPLGFYLQSSICSECSKGCLTCPEGPEKCQKCQANLFLFEESCTQTCNFLGLDHLCFTSCPPFTTDDTSGNCQKCELGCAQCVWNDLVNKTSCSQCLYGFEFDFQTKTCSSICATNKFFSLVSGECQSCSSLCAECIEFPDKCTKCQSDQLIYNSKCFNLCAENQSFNTALEQCEESIIEGQITFAILAQTITLLTFFVLF